MRPLVIAIALLGAGWSASAVADSATCAPRQDRYDFFVQGYYEVGTLWQVWEESNGYEGLQAGPWTCNGRSAPMDRCVARTDENNAAVNCSVAYMAGSL